MTKRLMFPEGAVFNTHHGARAAVPTDLEAFYSDGVDQAFPVREAVFIKSGGRKKQAL